MDIYTIREYCLSLPHTEETTPFDETTLVYKVGGRMFAVTSMDSPDNVVVKCDPDKAVELRDAHEEITTAWHFNKRHWNSIRLDGDLSSDFITIQIFESYAGGKEKRHAESAARADSCRGKKLRIPIIAGSIGRTGSALPRRTTGFPRTSNAATCRRTWVTAIHTGDPIICRIMAETRTCDSATRAAPYYPAAAPMISYHGREEDIRTLTRRKAVGLYSRYS